MKITIGSFERFEDIPTFSTDILFEIQYNDAVGRKFDPFLNFWDVERIAAAGHLHRMLGRVNFVVGGFDQDKREVVEIPELRIYLRELADKWPYFFYADALITGFLFALINCMVSEITIATTAKDQTRYTARIPGNALADAWKKLYDGLLRVCYLDKEMNQEAYNARVEAIDARLRGFFLDRD